MTQSFINCWMGKQMWYTYSGVLLTNIKEYIPNIFNTYEPQKCYFK